VNEGTAQVDGAQLAWSRSGAGPDVVLVHAGVADQRMWEPVVDRLADRCSLLRYDLRGFGRSDRFDAGPFSPSADLLGVLDAVGVGSAVLVGASFGGFVALEAAITAPERFGALVLLDAPLPDHAWSEEIEVFAEAEESALEDGDLDAAVDANVRMWTGPRASPRVRGLVAGMQRRAFTLQLETPMEEVALDPPAHERLTEVRAATTVAVGEHDVADFHAIGERLAREIPDAAFAVIADAGHLPALEQPDATAELIARAVAAA
jgi:pimeloyl-ACP methyl ester carboxylesterase